MLPGITGWAQVNHHYDRHRRRAKISISTQVRGGSAGEDLKIMLRTVPCSSSRAAGKNDSSTEQHQNAAAAGC